MFLRSIELQAKALPDIYPFTVPAIETLESLEFKTPVTFFVGENGCGKSTLLEAIACGMQCPAVGAADVARDPLMAPARALAKELRFVRSTSPKLRLFFRAEDAIGFTRALQSNLNELEELEAAYDRELTGYGRDLAKGTVRGQRNALEARYGENPDARSHGEWFINLIQQRVHGKGLYLLDEPETPLSPIHQLSLLSIMLEAVDSGAQFIIATHSPILMACPGATLYNLDGMTINTVDWEDVEHVQIMRAFLKDPDAYLRHL